MINVIHDFHSAGIWPCMIDKQPRFDYKHYLVFHSIPLQKQNIETEIEQRSQKLHTVNDANYFQICCGSNAYGRSAKYCLYNESMCSRISAHVSLKSTAIMTIQAR